ncbi:CBN-AQP-7 protein [Aphelenchoides avenae]|nr:CBN-AQP-7 protein [Aphelenchus avenae]
MRMLLIGTGIVAHSVLTEGELNPFIHRNIGWATAISMCVYTAQKITGGQLNPAVSLAQCLMGKITVLELLLFSIVQTLGAFLGSGISFYLYMDHIKNYNGGKRIVVGEKGTGEIFCSFPPEYVTNLTIFVSQVLGTALFVVFNVAITDDLNGIPKFLRPILTGVAIFVVAASYGMNVGYPVNPARDLGPRIFASIAGYGVEVFSYHTYFFWIPVVGPLVGSALGVGAYLLFIGMHLST